ncbi:ATP-binding protein [Kitasatospora azatica]|uniref:ATP-binding protein n=1 Tax=Kitasatospora azatica TaxID=58347 RepID=UPI00068D36E4|nr:ATP-binding protein [Kitasatospora azatica]
MTTSERSRLSPGPQPSRDDEQGDRGPRHGAAVFAVTAGAGSVPILRRLTRQTSRRWNLPGAVEQALAVIVTELVTNAVRHSGNPVVTLLLTVDDRAVTVRVTDRGRRRRLGSRRAGVAGSGRARGGRGLQLVEAYASKLTVLRTRAGTLAAVDIVLV